MFKKYAPILVLVAVMLAVASTVLIPSLAKKTGDAFFGKYPSLYNVTFAEFFFKKAAYPLIGKPVEFAHYQLSRTYFIQGNLNESLEEVQNELKLYPKNTRAYYILGLTLGYMDREPEAIDAFSRFIETAPMSWAARNDKAWLEFRIGRIDEAISTIEPILPHSKSNPWVQNTYGVLLLNKKRYTEAKEAFENAKRVANTYTPSNWGYAYPGNDTRVYAQGLEAFKDSIDTNLKLIKEKTSGVYRDN